MEEKNLKKGSKWDHAYYNDLRTQKSDIPEIRLPETLNRKYNIKAPK